MPLVFDPVQYADAVHRHLHHLAAGQPLARPSRENYNPETGAMQGQQLQLEFVFTLYMLYRNFLKMCPAILQ